MLLLSCRLHGNAKEEIISTFKELSSRVEKMLIRRG